MDREFLEQAAGRRWLEVGPVDAAPERGGGLAVEIDEQHFAPGRGERGGEIHRRGGLPHAPLVVDDSDHHR